MASLLLPSPRAEAGTGWHRWAPYALLMFAALAIRAPRLGDPALDYDEQLYLLIGDGLRHGLLPYVDLWDRKPIGLFLIYAAFDGVWRYQIAATLCAGATAGLIYTLARRSVAPAGAGVAGLGYLLWLPLFHGAGGQSPVFYTMLTAIAAWCAFAADDTRDRRRIARLGSVAMAACGVALQIKYVHLPEGVFFGGWFLWRLHRAGMAVPRLAGIAAGYVGIALAPTLAAFGVYAALGHLDAFVFANFVSIGHRHALPAATIAYNLGYIATVAAPLIGALIAVAWRWRRSPDAALMAGWLIAALVGFALVGNYYDNYVLPLLLPAFVAAAPLFARGRIGFAAAGVLLVWPIAIHPPSAAAAHANRAGMDALVAAVAPVTSSRRCLYVYDGPAELYRRSPACRATRFVYPDHLTNAAEADALGIDTRAEMVRILATRPGAIVTASRPLGLGFNSANQRLVHAALVRDYVTIAAVPFADRVYYVHALKASAPRTAGSDARADAAW